MREMGARKCVQEMCVGKCSGKCVREMCAGKYMQEINARVQNACNECMRGNVCVRAGNACDYCVQEVLLSGSTITRV